MLYRLTVHRFASVLSQRESRTVQEIDRPLVAVTPYVSAQLSVSVCPSCVAESESYDRLYWRLPLACVCPRHGQVLRHRCPDCQHPIKSLRIHAYRCGFCSQGDYRKEVARALGPSSALLNASRWMLQLAGVEREERGMPSRCAISMPERLEGMSPREISVLLESITRVFTLSYSWNELREMCEVWGMLTQRDRGILNQQSESQKLLVVLFFLGVFRNWPRQFESWLEEVFAAASIHGREKELMYDYQERMRQELFRDP